MGIKLAALITRHRNITLLVACLAFACAFALAGLAQDEVTGAFEGKVIDSHTNEPLKDVTVRFTNKETGVPSAKRTNNEGKFFQGLLPPGTYTIRISAQGFKTIELEQRLFATQVTKVIPYPIMLEPEEKPKP